MLLEQDTWQSQEHGPHRFHNPKLASTSRRVGVKMKTPHVPTTTIYIWLPIRTLYSAAHMSFFIHAVCSLQLDKLREIVWFCQS